MKLNTNLEHWLKKKHINVYRQPTIKRNNISRIFRIEYKVRETCCAYGTVLSHGV